MIFSDDSTPSATWVIFATATFLKTNICCYVKAGTEWSWITIEPIQGLQHTLNVLPNENQIHLINTNQNHFDLAFPLPTGCLSCFHKARPADLTFDDDDVTQNQQMPAMPGLVTYNSNRQNALQPARRTSGIRLGC